MVIYTKRRKLFHISLLQVIIIFPEKIDKIFRLVCFYAATYQIRYVDVFVYCVTLNTLSRIRITRMEIIRET